MDTPDTEYAPAAQAPGDPAATTKLTILYDERCALCRRSRDWLLTQPCLLEVELLPSGSVEAEARYQGMSWLGKELVAVDQAGRAWVGPAAFLTCLWATVRYRGWAYRLSAPALAPLAERFFMMVSKRRDRWSERLRRDDPDCSYCDQVSIRWGPPS
jgi:predicted DCC family thiol-disulfide oxidoreductase YuxK